MGVSSTIGKGFDKILPKADQLKQEYFEVFLPELLGRAANADQDDLDGGGEQAPAQAKPP